MADLSQLIERVEAATGPDRRIDAAIWYAVIEKPLPGEKRDRDVIGRWPAYTASLDAAMTLVPEGARWTMRTRHPGDKHRNVNAYFVHLESHDFKSVTWGKGENWITDRVNGWDVSAWAATPALALVAASLKARAQQGEG